MKEQDGRAGWMRRKKEKRKDMERGRKEDVQNSWGNRSRYLSDGMLEPKTNGWGWGWGR